MLSLSEIEQLINTHYRYENPQVRNAFIFCLYTGLRFCDVKDLRFCDVKDLTYGNVDYQNKILKFEQNKTKGHSGCGTRRNTQGLWTNSKGKQSTACRN